MRARRLLALVALVLVLVAAVAAGLALWVRAGGRPRRIGTASIPGLSAPVSVRWDRRGVPYVEAANGEDLAAALGYLHADDRMTQLELGRRLASGRLAELVGERAVAIDRRFRTLRLRRTAERLWAAAGVESRTWLEAYARGVNARLAEMAAGDRLPPGLRLLGGLGWTGPEPWTPVDSLCFVLLMANDLSFWEGRPEEKRYLWLRELGEERTRDLLGNPDLVVPPEILAYAREERARRSAASAPASPAAPVAPGSNNWVVGGSRTASGRPLVESDPHLGLRLPGVWYQVLLRAPGYEVAGMTIPGLPGVVIGHTAALAWGLTNVMLDDHDVYFEQLDDSGDRVRRGDGWAPVVRSRETIAVKGGAPVTLELAETDLGPLLPADEAHGLPPRSLVWTLYTPSDPMSAFAALARARGADDALAGLGGYTGPAQNLVVGSRDGELAWTVLGRIPERGAGDGWLPSPGWNPAYRWRGLRETATNPLIRDPPDDLLVTANNEIAPPDSPRFAADYDTPHRARRIRELLEEGGAWTPAATASVQTDVVSLYAREVVAHLGVSPDEVEGDAKRALALLTSWDGSAGPPIGAGPRTAGDDHGAALLFDLLARDLGEEIFGDEATAHGLDPLTSRERLLRVLDGGMDAAWFDDVRTPGKEGRREIVARALARAWREAAARWGPDPAAWSYRKLHTLTLAHPLGSVPLLGSWFNRGPIPISGSATTIAAFGAGWRGKPGAQVEAVTYGPSMRFVADTGDPDSTLAVLPGGQSGDPADPHYDDQLAAYLAGELYPFPWTEGAIDQATVTRMELMPAR